MAKPMMQQPLPIGRLYYLGPTPTSILFQENSMNSALSYNSRSIYEWNMDGQSEYQIITSLHNMLMNSIICRTVDTSDKQVAEFITARLFDQLKG